VCGVCVCVCMCLTCPHVFENNRIQLMLKTRVFLKTKKLKNFKNLNVTFFLVFIIFSIILK
jgi:hypothetical protein